MLGLIVRGVGCFPLHMPVHTPLFLKSVSRPTETVKCVNKIGVGFVLEVQKELLSLDQSHTLFFFLKFSTLLVSIQRGAWRAISPSEERSLFASYLKSY